MGDEQKDESMSNTSSSNEHPQQKDTPMDGYEQSEFRPKDGYEQSGFHRRRRPRYRIYNAIRRCKSAGVIPYAFRDNQLYFLFQKIETPLKRKYDGWNDFGGKQNYIGETTAEIAAREFSEETSCLFYLVESDSPESKQLYEKLKNKDSLNYEENDIEELKKTIPLARDFFVHRITQHVHPINVSSKETYISYFVKVKYLPASDLPRAEDIHILYEDRYFRECRWFSYDEVMKLSEKDFHKRLQITKIQHRIKNYYERDLFS